MALIETRMPLVGMKEARASLPEIVARLNENPARPYALVRYQETAAVILHPTTFDLLVEAAQEALDLRDAEEALATEPLESFAGYHARRLARRRSAESS